MNVAVKTADLYADALVWDNHACPPVEKVDAFMPRLEAYRAAGIKVLGLNVADSNIDLATMIRVAAAIRAFVAAHPEHFVLVRDADDIRHARRDGRMSIFLNVEGAYAVGDQLSLIEFFYDIGVRWMAMVYNRRNLVGSGVHDEVDEGLSPFGRQLIAEMDRVGMIKCCSHTGYRTAMDVFTSTNRPTIFSHSNPLALRDHPRNVPDELIRACAATGGVIGLNGVGIFLGDNDIRPETLANHVQYVADLVGPQHVGLGLDTVFDMSGMDAAITANAHLWPAHFGYRPGISFYQPEQVPDLVEVLLGRGWSETDVRGLLGENMLRVATQVWRKAS